jgi:hypothetical protein
MHFGQWKYVEHTHSEEGFIVILVPVPKKLYHIEHSPKSLSFGIFLIYRNFAGLGLAPTLFSYGGEALCSFCTFI